MVKLEPAAQTPALFHVSPFGYLPQFPECPDVDSPGSPGSPDSGAELQPKAASPILTVRGSSVPDYCTPTIEGYAAEMEKDSKHTKAKNIIQDFPYERLVAWRDDQAKAINPKIPRQLESVLAYERGILVQDICTYCQEGTGPFKRCVQLTSAFLECASCHWSGDYKRCSFREEAAPPRKKRKHERGYIETEEDKRAMAEKLSGCEIHEEVEELLQRLVLLQQVLRNRCNKKAEECKGASS